MGRRPRQLKRCSLLGLETCKKVQVRWCQRGVEDLGGSITFKVLAQAKSLLLQKALQSYQLGVTDRAQRTLGPKLVFKRSSSSDERSTCLGVRADPEAWLASPVSSGSYSKLLMV